MLRYLSCSMLPQAHSASVYLQVSLMSSQVHRAHVWVPGLCIIIGGSFCVWVGTCIHLLWLGVASSTLQQ